MAGKSFGEEFGEQLAAKAVMWGPAIAGAVLMGTPVGILAGLITSVTIVASGGSHSSPPSGDRAEK